MARPLRIEFPGAVYHITSRGNDKRPIFLDDKDRESFLNLLEHVNDRYHWICYAYCLMDNHYHLLIETLEGNLSIGMRQLNGVYTQSFNRRYERVGHLFQGRFKAILIEKDNHLLEVCRYVVLNPVRAGVVDNPKQWKWSSYRATGDGEMVHRCLTPDWILCQFGKKRGMAERKYKEFVRAGMRGESLWKGVKAQSIFGSEDFVGSLIDYVKGYEDIAEISKSQRYLSRPSLEQFLNRGAIQDKGARDERIEEAVEKYGYTQKEVSRHLGIHFTSVSRIMRNRKKIMLTK